MKRAKAITVVNGLLAASLAELSRLICRNDFVVDNGRMLDVDLEVQIVVRFGAVGDDLATGQERDIAALESSAARLTGLVVQASKMIVGAGKVSSIDLAPANTKRQLAAAMFVQGAQEFIPYLERVIREIRANRQMRRPPNFIFPPWKPQHISQAHGMRWMMAAMLMLIEVAGCGPAGSDLSTYANGLLAVDGLSRWPDLDRVRRLYGGRFQPIFGRNDRDFPLSEGRQWDELLKVTLRTTAAILRHEAEQRCPGVEVEIDEWWDLFREQAGKEED